MNALDLNTNEGTTVPPGGETPYTWYAGDDQFDLATGKQLPAPIEFGATVLRDMGDVIKHSSHGAIGTLIIEPEHSRWGSDCGGNASALITKTNAMKDVCDDTGTLLFRDMVVLYQDDLSLLQGGAARANLRNGDDAEDSGQKAFNYRTEPLWARIGAGGPAARPEDLHARDFTNAFSSKVDARGKCEFDSLTAPSPAPLGCDPETPLFIAKAGTPVRFRILHVAGHPRNHGFTLFGHNWESIPWINNSRVLGHNPDSDRVGSTSGIGPARHINLLTQAGGEFAIPGDYLYRTQEGFQFEGGLWGIFRVCDPKDTACLQEAKP